MNLSVKCISCQANSRIPPPEPVKMSTLPEKEQLEDISVKTKGKRYLA